MMENPSGMSRRALWNKVRKSWQLTLYRMPTTDAGTCCASAERNERPRSGEVV